MMAKSLLKLSVGIAQKAFVLRIKGDISTDKTILMEY